MGFSEFDFTILVCPRPCRSRTLIHVQAGSKDLLLVRGSLNAGPVRLNMAEPISELRFVPTESGRFGGFIVFFRKVGRVGILAANFVIDFGRRLWDNHSTEFKKNVSIRPGIACRVHPMSSGVKK